MFNKHKVRLRNSNRVRNRIKNDMMLKDRLRLSFFMSNKHIQVQLFDFVSGNVLYGADTRGKEFRAICAENYANHKKVTAFFSMFKKNLPDSYKGAKIVFDRAWRPYMGKVASFGNSLRECFVF